MSAVRRVLRLAVLIHRWAGIALCLMMMAWFLSGIIMIYTSFPLLPASEKYARSTPVDATSIRLSAADVTSRHALAPAPTRLFTTDGRPRYAIRVGERERCFFADTGMLCPPVDADSARDQVERHSGMPVATVSEPFTHDQWTVYGAFDSRRPYRRVRLDDAKGTDYYIAVTTGEIVQKTERQERFWNTLGSVVHWIYPTFIRKHWVLWDQLVWWVSLAGVVVVVLGMTLGVVRWRKARKTKRSSLFSGWLKWHHLTGLVAGTFVLTWIVSGWLSMDHGRLFSTPDAAPESLAQFHGLSFGEAAAAFEADQLATLPRFHSARFHAFAGEALISTQSLSGETHWGLQGGSLVEYRADQGEIEAAVGRSWPEASVRSISTIPKDDPYAYLREGSLGDHVLRVELETPERLWVHVDPDSLTIVNVMDDSRRAYRWWYNGLHSFDFPGLVERRPLWDFVMLTLLLAGLGVCVSSVVIGVRRLSR